MRIAFDKICSGRKIYLGIWNYNKMLNIGVYINKTAFTLNIYPLETAEI